MPNILAPEEAQVHTPAPDYLVTIDQKSEEIQNRQMS